MADYSDLIERLRKADGPDRELDAAIAWVTGFDATGSVGQRWRLHYAGHKNAGTVSRAADNYGVPNYTASVDAALSLVERVLPGWQIEQLSWESKPNGLVWCSIGNFGEGDNYLNAGNDEPKPICFAILIALLTALQHQGE